LVAAGPSPVKSKRGNAGDKANAEVMFAILHNLQRLMLDRKPHIKAYKKARKLQGEILGSMMAYYESGKKKIPKYVALACRGVSAEIRAHG